MVDLLETDGFLQPKVPLKITYTRTRPSFYLLTDETTRSNNYVFEIKKIGLHVPIIKVNNTILPHLKSLSETEPARYHFRGLSCKHFGIGIDTETCEIPGVYTSKIPQRLLIGIFKQPAIAGSITLSPFFTSKEVKIRSMELVHDGEGIVTVKPRFESNDYARHYKAFLEFLGVENDAYMIDYTNFLNGFRFLAFDFLEGCGDECSAEVLKSGQMNIKLEFEEPVREAHVLIAFGISPNTMDIDNDLKVRISQPVN